MFYYTDFVNFTTRISLSVDAGSTWNELTNLPLNGNFKINTLKYIPGSNAVIMTMTNESLLRGIFRTWVSYDDGKNWLQIDEGTNVGWMSFLNSETGWGGQPQMLNGPSYLFKFIGSPLVGLLQASRDEIDFTVMPNPFPEFIEINPSLRGDYLILINDVEGKLLFRNYYSLQENEKIKINLSFLKSGNYTITVSNKYGSSSRKLFKLP